MKKHLFLTLGGSILLISALAVGLIMSHSTTMARPSSQTLYSVKGTNASLQREVTGPVTTSVQGVPASPVDSFVWDGIGSVPLTDGVAHLEIDPVNNTGRIIVQWSDENGKWKLVQEAYSPPGHPTGLIVGPSASSTVLVSGDPITTNVYLHGDTTAGGPVLPTIFNLLATWGPAKVTLNGKPFNNPFDGPVPLWATHTMLTVGVRGDDGTVRKDSDGSIIFSPGPGAGDGAVDNDDLELHVVFHDAPGPTVSGNFPPPLSFFYHLTFEDVTVDISHIN